MIRQAEVRLFALDDARPRHPAVERWFDGQPAALRSIARVWFEAMRACGPDVTETLHDGQPTACVGRLAFGYVDAFTGHVNVGFFAGTTLEDPYGLLEGKGRFMRHVKLRPGKPVDERALRELIGRAHAAMSSRLSGDFAGPPSR